MKIVGFIRTSNGVVEPVSYYRIALPLRAIEVFTGHHTVSMDQNRLASCMRYAQKIGADQDNVVSGFDIYILGRLYRSEGLNEYIEAVHRQGAVAVFETDDDLSEEYRELDGRGREFLEVVKSVDYVTVSTDYLARRMSKYAKRNPIVLKNCVDFQWFSGGSLSTKRLSDKFTIGVVGTKTHYNDWRFCVEAFEKLLDEYSDVEILTAGYQPDYLSHYTHLEPVPYNKYPSLLRQFDVVCCALDESDGFNKSKSSIKALEAAAAARELSSGVNGGAVPVCTNCEAYKHTIKNNVNGLLIDNTEWYSTLKYLVDNRSKWRALSRKSHRWVERHRSIKHGYKKWERAYSRMV